MSFWLDILYALLAPLSATLPSATQAPDPAGGVAIWELSQDTRGKTSLLGAIFAATDNAR